MPDGQPHAEAVVQYRDATALDAESIAALHADSWRRHYRGAYLDAYLDGDVVTDRREVWTSRLALPRTNQFTVVAQVNDEVIGFAHTVLDDDPRWGSLLENLHVRSERKRSGIGTHLLSVVARGCSGFARRDRSTSGCSTRTPPASPSTTPVVAPGSRRRSGDPSPAAEGRSVTGTPGRTPPGSSSLPASARADQCTGSSGGPVSAASALPASSSYAGDMTGSQGEQSPPGKRKRRAQRWGRRMMKGTEQTPERELEQSREVLSWALRNEKPDSPFTIKAMIDVADQLSKQDRPDEELALREQAVAALRRTPGPEHESTLNAEWKLATCLTTLGRPGEAEPLLADVVAAKTLAVGRDAPETLMAMAWAAAVAKKLGKLEDARALQEEVVAGYQTAGLGDDRATQAALNLGATLTELGEFDEASRLLRRQLTALGERPGLESEKALDVLEALARVTYLTGNVAEATLMAGSLLEQRVGAQGDSAAGANRPVRSSPGSRTAADQTRTDAMTHADDDARPRQGIRPAI